MRTRMCAVSIRDNPYFQVGVALSGFPEPHGVRHRAIILMSLYAPRACYFADNGDLVDNRIL